MTKHCQFIVTNDFEQVPVQWAVTQLPPKKKKLTQLSSSCFCLVTP